MNNKILDERKKYLGLTKVDTEKIYNEILEGYKQAIIKAPRDVFEYSIDIVLCNMNFYNKLGDLKKLNETWGDSNFFVDTTNSEYVKLYVDDEGNIDSDEGIYFKDAINIDEIKDISFSLKELTELCKKDNVFIRIYAREEENYETTVEIRPNKPFEMHDSVKEYLETVK